MVLTAGQFSVTSNIEDGDVQTAGDLMLFWLARVETSFSGTT